VIVAFLLQANLIVRICEVALFALLATLAGKRIKWLYFLVMVTSVTFFNVLTPVGELLIRLGPVRITRGALEQGLMKGFAIVGLVFVSLFAVRPDLRLPGALGGVLARLFFYFELIFDSRKRVSARRLVSSVDEILLSIYPGSELPEGDAGSSRNTIAGIIGMVVVTAACWSAAMLSLLHVV